MGQAIVFCGLPTQAPRNHRTRHYPGFGAHLALMGGVPVVLAQPLTSESWLNERLDQFGEAPCAFVLGANRPGRYHAASVTRWFGIEISWFDSNKLGWRLGFESPEW